MKWLIQAKRYRWWIASLIAVGLTLLWIGTLRGSKPIEVVVEPVVSEPLILEWAATGYVESRSAEVSSPEAARVVSVLRREGDRVREGDLLARLESRGREATVQAESAGVRATEAQAEASKAALDEARAAYSARLGVAEAELSAARERWRSSEALLQRDRKLFSANLSAAQAQADAARAELAQLRAGARAEEIARAEAELDAAEAAATRAKIERDRQERLQAQGATSRQALDDATELYVRAQATVRSRQASLDLLRKGARAEEIAAGRARLQAAEDAIAAVEAGREGLEAGERQVQEARAAVDAASSRLEEVRSGRARLRNLSRQVEAAQAQADQGKAAEEVARAGLEETVVRAPFDGVIGRRFVDPGDLATPGNPLFTVVDQDQIWIAAELDEQELAPVRVGQRVTIESPAYLGREFEGTVDRIGGEAVPQTEIRTGARIVRVQIRLLPTSSMEQEPLRPGMEVYVTGANEMDAEAILAPNEALLTDRDGAYVFLYEGQIVRKRRVKTGYITGLHTEILEGLDAGDRVVVSDKERLEEGQAVFVRESK